MNIQNPIPLSLKKEESASLQISIESPIMLNQTQNGLARGYSAYEIAVKNGFEGTEVEWLDTLKEDSWDIVEFDSATSGTLICDNKVIYIINASTRPVTAIIPDSNIYDFSTRIILDNNTHKVSVTTPTGETAIGNDTIQIIPLEQAQLYIKYHTHDSKYHIITDTRQIHMLELLTESRDFSDGDGAEHMVEYRSETEEGDMFTHTLKEPQSYPGGMVLEYTFSIKGNGTVVVTCPTHPIGDRNDQVLNLSGSSFTIVEANGEYFVKNDTRPKVVNTSVTSYPLNENDTIIDTVTGTLFKKRTNSVTDGEFSQSPTQQPYTITANPTDSYQCFSSSICKAGILDGLLPEGSIDIYWNLRRTGNVDVNVYAEYYIRESNGDETLIATTNTTKVNSDVLTQYRLVANHIELHITSTDRLVVRVFARKDKTGTNPVLYQEVEGTNPTRSMVEVAIATLSHNAFSGRDLEDCHPIEAITGLEEILNSAYSTVLTCTVGTGGDYTTFNTLQTYLNANRNIVDVTVNVISNFSSVGVALSNLRTLNINFNNYTPTVASDINMSYINFISLNSGESMNKGTYSLDFYFNIVGVVQFQNISLGQYLFVTNTNTLSASVVLPNNIRATAITLNSVSNVDLNFRGDKQISLVVSNSNVYINSTTTISYDPVEITAISMLKYSNLAIDNVITVVPVGWTVSKTIQDGSNYGQYYKGI